MSVNIDLVYEKTIEHYKIANQHLIEKRVMFEHSDAAISDAIPGFEADKLEFGSYDKENFEVVGSTFLNNDVEITDSVGIDNPDYYDSVRSVHSTINTEAATRTDGHIMKLTMKSLTGKEGSFALKNRYDSSVGEETTVILEEGEDFKQTMLAGTMLVVDETPVTINAGK